MRERRINCLLRCLIYGPSCKASGALRAVCLYKGWNKAAPDFLGGGNAGVHFLDRDEALTKLLPQNARRAYVIVGRSHRLLSPV